jgi:lipopolysaccharide export system protein LptA
MEKIDPQQDHQRLQQHAPGQKITFKGKVYTIQRRTTLASGEAAVVLQGDQDQFVISANEFLNAVR